MKGKVKNTGEIVNVELCNDYNMGTFYYVVKGDPDKEPYEIGELEILDYNDDDEEDIDWDERRYELAKAAMQGILSDESQMELAYKRTCHRENGKPEIPNAVARFAVDCADALINELKNE